MPCQKHNYRRERFFLFGLAYECCLVVGMKIVIMHNRNNQ